MSSRVVRVVGTGVEPITWRQVGDAGDRHEPARTEQPGPAEHLAQMESQHKQAIEQARTAAFRDGEAAGRKQAAAEVQPVIERLARSVEDLALLRTRLRREAENDMLRLALAVARRVLRRELSVDPEALHGLALAALEKLSTEQVHRVRVHPSMAPQMRALLEKSAARQAVEVMPDPAREPGALIFETDRGKLDVSVDTQLQEIERGLTDRLGGQS